MQFERWVDVDLDKATKVIDLGAVFTGDNDSVKLGAVIKKDGVAQTVTGTVKGIVLMPNGTALPEITGDSDGNKAWVEIPEDAFDLQGRLQIAIRITTGSVKTIVLAATASVRRAGSATAYDPDDEIPTWDSIQDKIDAMDDAADACTEATEAALAVISGAVSAQVQDTTLVITLLSE